MSFVRPGAARVIRRWREVGIWIAVAALGLWVALSSALFWRVLGGMMLVIGLGLALVALRYARRPEQGEGPGVLTVDERAILYMGPEFGGAISIDALREVSIEHWRGEPQWRLSTIDGQLLQIPGGALGAERLFDAFSALPGADFDAANRALAGDAGARVVVWRKRIDRPRLPARQTPPR